jgi:hypothetical protein
VAVVGNAGAGVVGGAGEIVAVGAAGETVAAGAAGEPASGLALVVAGGAVGGGVANAD